MPSPDPLVAALVAGLIVALVLATVLGWACYRLLVDRGRLLLLAEEAETHAPRSPSGLREGSFLSDFALPVLGGDGTTVTLSGLARKPLLLVFVQPDCIFSHALAWSLRARASAAPLPVLVISGEASSPETLAPFIGLPGPVLLDAEGQVARLMRVPVTPTGYLVDQDRRTMSRLLVGPVALLAAARKEPIGDGPELPPAVSPLPTCAASTLEPLQPGMLAPDFALPHATGGEWSLHAHRGEPLALIFSDPTCPPCTTLLAALRRRDRAGLVLVSRGAEEANQAVAAALGTETPVLLQRHREVARWYGIVETPAAYSIDERGIIMAGPAIGTKEVLALLERRRSRRKRCDPDDRLTVRSIMSDREGRRGNG